jgi:hypothetical protein
VAWRLVAGLVLSGLVSGADALDLVIGRSPVLGGALLFPMKSPSRRDELSFWEWLRASAGFMRSLTLSLVISLCFFVTLPLSFLICLCFFVTHTLQECRKPKCPRCGKRLATDKAQQCFGCGLRWHGSPRPDARSEEFANWPHEKYESFFREVIQVLREGTLFCISICFSISWNLCVWRVVRGRWREAEAWAAAGVGSEDIRALKQLINSHRFEDPIIGIERISENKHRIDVGWQAGPLTGAGTTLMVRRGENGWRIEQQSRWVS